MSVVTGVRMTADNASVVSIAMGRRQLTVQRTDLLSPSARPAFRTADLVILQTDFPAAAHSALTELLSDLPIGARVLTYADVW